MAAIVVAATLLAGCGGGEQTQPATAIEPNPQPGGTLVVAMGDEVNVLDPLFATSRADRLASRQVHEPLVSEERGPFGSARSVDGLARRVFSNGDATVWTVVLRRGIRFQSGEALDAESVLANVSRWRRIDRSSRLLGDLQAADSPRPGFVRLIYDSPEPDLVEILANPRLGIVAPSALRQAGASEVRPGPTGCGPFEYRGRDGTRLTLARSIGWWGQAIGLGPGVDQVELEWVPKSRDRFGGLLDGAFDVVDGLSARAAERLARHSLLAAVGSGENVLGVDRSVRGIQDAKATQSLTDVWLTDLR